MMKVPGQIDMGEIRQKFSNLRGIGDVQTGPIDSVELIGVAKLRVSQLDGSVVLHMEFS